MLMESRIRRPSRSQTQNRTCPPSSGGAGDRPASARGRPLLRRDVTAQAQASLYFTQNIRSLNFTVWEPPPPPEARPHRVCCPEQ